MKSQNMFDHLALGKSLKYFVYPLTTLSNRIGFEDGLEAIIPEKLEKLLDRCKELKNKKGEKFLLISQSTQSGSITEYFYTTLASLEFAEYYVIQKWINYWLSLWYQLPGKSLPKNLSSNLSRLGSADIERAKQRSLEELYEGQLKKSGSRLVGLCPFHEEKTASFYVFPDNHYFCFGCSQSGDPISFIQKTKNLSFPEAVRWLL